MSSASTAHLPLIVIVGPTAVGKTEIAITLAGRLGGEIVSADSRLFYRGMDIGTAKPTPAELSKVPHYLVNVADPGSSWSLSIFQKAAAEAIREISGRGRLPFLVGGTGQYVQAVTHAWSPPAVSPNPALRAILEGIGNARGKEWLHERLARLDPLAADSIDPRNLRRTVRAMEVILTSGERFSLQRRRSLSPYQLIMIGLIRPRTELYARIDERIEKMFACGLLGEVQGLLAHGIGSEQPAMSSIGYAECCAVIRGEMTVDQAKQLMKKRTRIFVRRQANWFKANDPSIRWFDAGISTTEEMEAYLLQQLAHARTA